jgi:hypothetical protein
MAPMEASTGLAGTALATRCITGRRSVSFTVNFILTLSVRLESSSIIVIVIL